MLNKCIRFATIRHPDDFVKRRIALDQQFESYRRVQRPVRGVATSALDRARALSARDQPSDETLREQAFYDYLKMFSYPPGEKSNVTERTYPVGDVQVVPLENDSERWERSRAEALAVTRAKAMPSSAPEVVSKAPYDPYASQRHKRGKKSHLAAAINKNIHDNPGMGIVWFAIFVILFIGSLFLSFLK